MVQEVLICISLIIVIATVLTIIFRLIKQPPIIAYLITGVLAGPFFLNLVRGNSYEIINLFAHLGVAFLLFIVGLNLNWRVLKEVGIVSTFAGIAEILITGVIGFLIAFGLGFSNNSALYLGIAIAFSSTVVVVKILSDKKEIDTLHGKISLGILIIEDFIAAIALMIIPIVSGGKILNNLLIKGSLILVLIALIFFISHILFKKFLNYLARSQEILFLFGLTWALVLSILFNKLGFSLEIGALIAGMSLASSRYHMELGDKMKTLRDFFIILFFVFFGIQLAGTLNYFIIRNAILLSFFVIIGKPIIVMIILRIFGYKKRTNFLAGINIAQISEFSLIITLLGFTLGHIGQEIMSLIVLVSIITIGLSSYSIYYSNHIFNKLSKWLNIFEGKREFGVRSKKKDYKILLFGYHRAGYKILKILKSMNVSFAVVDYNPKVILSLVNQGIDCIYGDASDKEFLNELELDKTSLIISTIPDEQSNIFIREKLKEVKSDSVFIATAEHSASALDLYREGIDYVIVPHYLGGDYAANIIKNFGTKKEGYKELRKKHLKELRDERKFDF
ncbi:cation:proton antiporter [Candidatus Pacearchaeota archaeon]|nr:cation:proton antiporter [Candidatus Pacearchaeota archaeon]